MNHKTQGKQNRAPQKTELTRLQQIKENKKKIKSRQKKTLLIGGVSTVGTAAIVYIGFAVFFHSHYLWNTSVGAIACGGKTAEYAVEESKKLADDYLLSVEDRKGNLFPVKGEDVDYAYVPSGEEESILEKQNPFAWIASIFHESRYELPTSISYDEDKAKQAVADLKIFDEDYAVAPSDAKIVLGESTYEIVPEDNGNKPVYDNVFAEVKAAMDRQEERIELSDECYEKPQLYADDAKITDAKAAMDRYLAAEVTYQIGEAAEKITSADIYSWLLLGDDFSVRLDDAKVKKFVQNLCNKYNTYGDEREFKTASGDTLRFGGGDFGWVVSKKGETAQLMQDLEGGQPVSREPVWEQTAVQFGANDYGNTYVEIDYSKQHMWYFKDGALQFDTDVVTGNISRQNGSVDGFYSISYKQKDATLVGEDYSSPVKFFMPFAYNIGFHDASWRSEFGGDIYLKSGSHGCINMPPAMAQKMYETVPKNTPVIAYYRTPVALTNNAAKMSNAYSYKAPDPQ